MRRAALGMLIIAVLAICVTVVLRLAGEHEGKTPFESQDLPVKSSKLASGQASAIPEPIEPEMDADEFSSSPASLERGCKTETRYLVNGDGTVTESVGCVMPDSPAEPHPYDDYSNDTLATMAYGDAEAAELLGKRLAEAYPEKALELMIRASALSGGDPEPIFWIQTTNYSVVGVDGIPQIDWMKTAYVLRSVAARLRPGSTSPQAWLDDNLVDHLSPDDFAALDFRIESLVQYMREVQFTVLGESTINSDCVLERIEGLSGLLMATMECGE